jgi:HK97 gp10 family phage protein
VVVDHAVDSGAERVVQSAKDRVPIRSGALRNAIHTEDERDPRGGQRTFVIAGNDDVFYGHLVEHGTTHVAPRPFLVPALEEHRADIVMAAAAAIRNL